MQELPHSQELGATAGCTVCLVEGAQYGGRIDSCRSAEEERKPLLIYGDSWFGSKKCCRYLKKELGHESVMAVKTNHSGLPKEELEKLMDNYPSGASVVLKSTENDCVLYFIGYKYNSRKVLCFICSENAGSFQPGKPYEARFPNRSGNVMV